MIHCVFLTLCGLDIFALDLQKIDVHKRIDMNETKRKVITFENTYVYCTVWYILHNVCKIELYKQTDDAIKIASFATMGIGL